MKYASRAAILRLLIPLLPFALPIIARADAPAADSMPPENVFHNRGLAQSGFWLILPYEKDVHDGVGSLKQKDETVRGEIARRRDLRFQIQNDRHALEGLLDKLVATDREINRLIATRQRMNEGDRSYEDLINMYNTTLHQRDALNAQVSAEQQALDDATARENLVSDSRQSDVNQAMDVGTRAESVASAYAGLAKDDELMNTIARANASAQPPLRLGPSPAFIVDLKFARDAVKAVVDGTIPVQKADASNEVRVQTVLNGKFLDNMLWDSGADSIVLSAETAKAIGVTFSDKDPVDHMIGADGKVTEVRIITLDSIRLGGFTLKNAPCTILPKSANGVSPSDLLGDTFQSHFLSRLDQRTRQLQLTPIDSDVTCGAIPQPLAELTVIPKEEEEGPNLASEATVQASSTSTGYDPRAVTDGVVDGFPNSPGNEWACGDRTGSITLTWPDKLTISTVKLWDRVNKTDHILTGQLVFDDNSAIPFADLPKDRTPLVIHFRPKYTRWIRVEILTVSKRTFKPGFAEIAAFR